MSEIESKSQETNKYTLLDNLTQHDGWPILLSELERVKNIVTQALLQEKDYNKIVRYQERYRAFDSVIMILKSSKSIKEKLYEEMQDILEDEQLKKEYDI